jgi:threonine/homoserine/homoserine lactone efflux protein
MQWSAYWSFLVFAAVLILIPGVRRSLDGATGLALLGFSTRLAAEQA